MLRPVTLHGSTEWIAWRWWSPTRNLSLLLFSGTCRYCWIERWWIGFLIPGWVASLWMRSPKEGSWPYSLRSLGIVNLGRVLERSVLWSVNSASSTSVYSMTGKMRTRQPFG